MDRQLPTVSRLCPRSRQDDLPDPIDGHGELAYHPPTRPTWTYFFRFRGENPAVGRPFIKLVYGPNDRESQQYSLSEGTLIGCLGPHNPPGCGNLGGQRGVDGFDLVLYRDADTNVKKLSITIVKAPTTLPCQPGESPSSPACR